MPERDKRSRILEGLDDLPRPFAVDIENATDDEARNAIEEAYARGRAEGLAEGERGAVDVHLEVRGVAPAVVARGVGERRARDATGAVTGFLGEVLAAVQAIKVAGAESIRPSGSSSTPASRPYPRMSRIPGSMRTDRG